MPRFPAAHRYYDALCGAWEGTLTLSRTARGLSDAPPALRRLAWFFALGPSVRMRTTLSRVDGGYDHTTHLGTGPADVPWTAEHIDLTGDRPVMRGVQRAFAGMVPYTAEAWIADAGDAATYEIPWAETVLIQNTRIVSEGLRLEQETSWTRAHVLLRRRAE